MDFSKEKPLLYFNKFMIYVSQGDIESIGLEVFIKSLFLIPRKFQKKIYLVVNKEVIKKHLDLLNYKYKFNKDTISISNFISISCIYIENFEDSPFKSFQYCVDNIDPKSVLFTLPMSKKNFQQASVRCLGHTDFFRNQFKNNKPKIKK